MRLKIEQLGTHLARSLAPVYVVSGDEPLQSIEALDAIRATARQQGFGERVVMRAERTFDWDELAAHSDSLGLFADKRIIELHLSSLKIGQEGSAALVRYTQRLSEDNLLLLSCGKLDASVGKSKWVKALDAAGVVLQVWPMTGRGLKQWVEKRASAMGLRLDSEASAVLAERIEGNLVLCVQELKKLQLISGEDTVGVEDVVASVADCARYSVYEAVDSALAGDARRAIRVVRSLKEEGVEGTVLLWALARELRTLTAIATDVANGVPIEQALREHGVWQKRAATVRAALDRHEPHAWLGLMSMTRNIDLQLKRGAAKLAWDALERLTLGMAGVVIFPGNPYRVMS